MAHGRENEGDDASPSTAAGAPMLIDRYPFEDVFARVPELAQHTDPVLRQLDSLLDDDRHYQQVRADLGTRYPLTLVAGRHSTPGEAILRLLVVKHLYNWSYRQTVHFVADSLVLRWFCRIYFETVPDFSTLQRWARDHPAGDPARPQRSSGAAGAAGEGHQGPEVAHRWDRDGDDDPPPDR